MSHRFRLFSFCAISTYARAVAQRSRAELLLNASWDTVLDAEGGKIPPEGWAPRRVQAMPLAGDKPVTSVWYRHHMRVPGEWVKHGSQFLLHVQRTGHYA